MKRLINLMVRKQTCFWCKNLYFLVHIQSMSCILINLIKFHLSKDLIIDWLQNITIILFKLAIALNSSSPYVSIMEIGIKLGIILRCRDP